MTGIEVALLGSAAAGSAAATTGLIGTAGAFSLGTAASTAFSVLGPLVSMMSQSNAASYNADIASRNATIARQQAEADAAKHRISARKQIGGMKSAYGASGVSSSEGSPLELLEDSAFNAEMDAQNILYSGKLKAMGYQGEARLEKMRSKNAISEGFTRAGTALLTRTG
jgi:hypothetical protein